MQKRVNKTKVSQKRDSQANMQIHKKLEASPDRSHDSHPLENITCKIGDNACAAKHVSGIQRSGLFHPMNKSQKAQSLLRLQRQYGNRFVQRVIAQHAIQTKLTVSQPGDIYEKEADRVAEQVMQMSEPQVQRQMEEEEEEELQTKPLAEQITPLVQRQIEEEEEELQAKELPGQTHSVTADEKLHRQPIEEEEEELQAKKISSQMPDLEARINAIKGGGQPIPTSTRAFFEPRFDYDFSKVRVHTDAESDRLSRAVNARSFTTGQDIFFRQGEYSPGSSSGRKLLAHELTHVVQQNGDRVKCRFTIDQFGDKYESEAGQVARAVMREQQPTLKEASSGLARPQEETAQIKAEGTWVQRQAEEEEPGETETTPETGESETEETPATAGPVEPVRIVRDRDLWWFDGENAANYDEEARLTAFGGRPGATRGTFRWDVVRGAGIVDFQNGSDSMTRVNANRIGIRSTDASAAMGDVRVRCRWSHGSARRTLYHAFTVRAPDAGVAVARDPDIAVGAGFRTVYTIEVRDQFGTRLPRPIEVNETFGAWVSDFPGENWPPPAEVSDMSNANAQVIDTYEFDCAACTPSTVNPGATGAGTRVDHATQRYRAGSLTAGDGRLIKTHTLQFYRGRARQE